MKGNALTPPSLELCCNCPGSSGICTPAATAPILATKTVTEEELVLDLAHVAANCAATRSTRIRLTTAAFKLPGAESGPRTHRSLDTI
jgi:hypothetical protein